jgi:hypothetical protein
MSDEDLENIFLTSSEIYKTDSIGYVYILFRLGNPGLAKVGFTAISPQSRAASYTDGEWKVHKQFPMPVWLARLAERTTHRNLKSYWLDPKITGGTASEIFTCSLETAESAVESACNEQIEIVLKSLKVPQFLLNFVLNKNGKTEADEFTNFLNQFEEKKQLLINEIDELNEKINALKYENEQESSSLSFYKNKYLELSESIELVKKQTFSELKTSEGQLKKFNNKEISYAQFEELKENFRRAVKLIESYKIREL